MVVCQYFLKGTCRFGSQCRNEHPKGGFGQTQNFAGLNKSSFQTSRGQSGNNPWGKFQNNNNNNNNGDQDSPEKIVQTIKQEMELWKNSKMWPFSCFSYQKEKPCLAGLTDYSVEEIRLEAYKGKETGNMNTYLNSIKQLHDQWMARLNELKSLNASTWDHELRKIGGTAGSGQFQTSSKGSGLFSTSSGLFSNQTEKKSTGLFGQSSSGQSIFGQSTGQTSGQSIFGKQSAFRSQSAQPAFGSQPVKPLFGQASSTQPAGQGLFAQTPQPTNQGIFGQQAQQPNQGLFSKPANQMSSTLFTPQPAAQGASQGLFSTQPTQGLFSSQPSQGLFSKQPTQGSLFGGNQQTQSNPFGQQQQQQKPALSSSLGNNNQLGIPQPSTAAVQPTNSVSNPFLQAAMQQSQQTNNAVPEIASDLPVTEKDLAAFKADRFVYGQIPECPPPLELC